MLLKSKVILLVFTDRQTYSFIHKGFLILDLFGFPFHYFVSSLHSTAVHPFFSVAYSIQYDFFQLQCQRFLCIRKEKKTHRSGSFILISLFKIQTAGLEF